MAEVIAGRFELIEHIAQGGSGSVWLARDLQCRRRCAAKVMRQSYSGELLRFVREQGVKFDHPHLLTPYGWAAVDDRVVIASQLMRGGNLHTALQDYGAMSPELTAEVLAQLLEALGHVHAAGWIHRDVKPANVLLELTGTGVPRVRLTDFGIAAHRDQPRLTQLGITVGTDDFLAPGQRAGADPEPAQDLYALGVLGVQLLDPALHGPALRERCEALSGQPPAGPLERVLVGLLSPQPDDRQRAAARAPELLAGLRNREGYRVASGEVFEVFDHFPPNEAPDPAGPDAAVPPQPEPAIAREAEAAQRRGAPRKALPWALLALAVLLGALSLWLIGADQGAGQDAGQGSTDPAPQQQTPGPEPGTASAAPSTPASAPSTPASKPSASDPGVEISSNVQAGEQCTVLEAGLKVRGLDDEQLRCEEGDTGYRWHPMSPSP